MCEFRLPKVVAVEAGEVGVEWLPAVCSNNWFAGADMIDSDVINDDIISGEAGWICTRFEEGIEGPWSDLRRACCLVRLGIGGVGLIPSMAPAVGQTGTPESDSVHLRGPTGLTQEYLARGRGLRGCMDRPKVVFRSQCLRTVDCDRRGIIRQRTRRRSVKCPKRKGARGLA